MATKHNARKLRAMRARAIRKRRAYFKAHGGVTKAERRRARLFAKTGNWGLPSW